MASPEFDVAKYLFEAAIMLSLESNMVATSNPEANRMPPITNIAKAKNLPKLTKNNFLPFVALQTRISIPNENIHAIRYR